MDTNTLRYLEPLVRRDDNDPALIEPRLQAFRAMEVAKRSKDPRQILYAETRLSELKELR